MGDRGRSRSLWAAARAVEMAETERADGADKDATRLAESVVATQPAEITRMEGMLG